MTVAAVPGTADSANVSEAEGWAAADFQAAGWEVAVWDASLEATKMGELVTVAAVSGAAGWINAHLGRPGGVMPFTAVASAAERIVWL